MACFTVFAAFLIPAVIQSVNGGHRKSGISSSSSPAAAGPLSASNVLLVIKDSLNNPVGFSILHFDPVNSRLVILPVSGAFKAAGGTLSSSYASGGYQAAVRLIASGLNVKIPYYCGIAEDRVAQAVNMAGGVDYTVPLDIDFTLPDGMQIIMKKTDSPQFIDGNKFYALIAFTGYGSEEQRLNVQGGLLRALANQRLSGSGTVSQSAPGSFFDLTDTNVNAAEVIDYSSALSRIISVQGYAVNVPPVYAGRSANDVQSELGEYFR